MLRYMVSFNHDIKGIYKDRSILPRKMLQYIEANKGHNQKNWVVAVLSDNIHETFLYQRFCAFLNAPSLLCIHMLNNLEVLRLP